jgi:hypothetical protein
LSSNDVSPQKLDHIAEIQAWLEFPLSIRAVRYFYCLTRFLRIIPWGARFLL